MAANYQLARKNMIESQIRTNKVTDERILDSMSNLPREQFVPLHMQGFAYVDEDVDLGNGRFLQEPLILARLVQAANIKSTDIVLVIGAATGYSPALIGRLAATVVGVESDQKLADQADTLLHELDIVNTAVIQGDENLGYPKQAPYDVILINGAVPRVPEHILEQMSEGGRLITVIAKSSRVGEAVLIERKNGEFTQNNLFEATTPFLRSFTEDEKFTF